MGWGMAAEEVEAALERIWDLHDEISDAIHTISRAHFLKSIRNLAKSATDKVHPEAAEVACGGGGRGFVFMKGFAGTAAAEDEAAMAEARGLDAIRTALENLEDQLEYFHTVQLQQRAEQEAALARLEKSRVLLAMRLADYHGKKYKVIEDALAFVGRVDGTGPTGRFVAPENLFEVPRGQSAEHFENYEGKRPSLLTQMLISSLDLARKTVRMENISSILGNAALFAISMLALLQLHQVALSSNTPEVIGNTTHTKRNEKGVSKLDSSSKQFDVMSARG